MPTFEDYAREQRRGNRGTSARDMLRLLGIISLIASGCFWYPVQWDLTSPSRPPEVVIALAFGTFLVLGPPVFTSFFVPWSPAAMLLAKINMRSIGQTVALGCMLYLIYYAGLILFSWWSTRPVVVQTNLIEHQVIVGIIATIVSPALLWAPASTEELSEILRQDNLVRKYELQVQADMAYLQGMLLDAQRAAAVGLSKIVAEQGGDDIAWRMQWLVDSIDQTIGEIAHTHERVSGTMAAFPTVRGNDDAQSVLDYMARMLQRTTSQPAQIATYVEPEPQQVIIEPPAPARTRARSHSRYVPPEGSQALAEPYEPSREVSPAPASAREVSPPVAATGSHSQEPQAELSMSSPLMVAQATLGGSAWMRHNLQIVLNIRETRAGDFIRQWKAQGLVEELTEPKFHYHFIKKES